MPDDDRLSALEMARTDRRAPPDRRIQRARNSGLRREPAQPMLPVQAQSVHGLRGQGGELGIERYRRRSQPRRPARLSARVCKAAARKTRAPSVGRSRVEQGRRFASCRARWACRPGIGRHRPACHRASRTARKSRSRVCSRSTAASSCCDALGFRIVARPLPRRGRAAGGRTRRDRAPARTGRSRETVDARIPQARLSLRDRRSEGLPLRLARTRAWRPQLKWIRPILPPRARRQTNRQIKRQTSAPPAPRRFRGRPA